jgi:predicted transcriptional regulator
MSGNDLSPLGKLRLEFCEGTGFTAPSDVIEAGLKTTNDWLEMLDKHRLEHPSHAKPTTTEPLKAELDLRKQILECLSIHCITNKWGLSVKEVSDALGKANNTVRDLLSNMTEEGLVSSVQVLRPKKGNAMLYRIAGIDEVNHE